VRHASIAIDTPMDALRAVNSHSVAWGPLIVALSNSFYGPLPQKIPATATTEKKGKAAPKRKRQRR